MRNKKNQLLPYITVLSLIMLICALLALFFSRTLFYIQGSLALAGLFASLVIYLNYNNYLKSTVGSAVSATQGVDKKYLNRFGFPVAVAGKDNEIVWFNDEFERVFCTAGDLYGMSVSKIIPGRSLAELCGSKGGNIEFGQSKYTVYANPVDNGFLLYFFDDTYYKNVETELYESRQSMAIAYIDNRETLEELDEDETARVVVQVESLLQKWAADHNALYRKMGASKYMFVFEEREIKKLESEKFSILSSIREIMIGDTSATVSIGVGRGEDSLRKSQASAKRALDMALGRGGDQAVILKDGEFEFYGGKSRGVESHSKVRVRVITKSLITAIEECDKVILMGHKFSDLDCVGAAIGLYGAITRSFDKEVKIAVDYNTSMAKSLIDAYKTRCGEGVFVQPDTLKDKVTDDTLLIILDTQSASRVESSELYSRCKKVIVIDHHRMSVDHISNSMVFYHEPGASSASEMCVEIIDGFPEDKLQKAEAEALLSGILLDTKNFVVNSGTRTFEAAAYLKKHGADTVAVRQLFSDSIEIYKNKYKLVSTARIYKRCAIVMAQEKMSDMRLLASKAADELLGLKGVNASFVVFKSEDNSINISARSYGKRNVQIIMEKLGGGGHHAMAAAQLGNVTFEVALRQLIKAIDDE